MSRASLVLNSSFPEVERRMPVILTDITESVFSEEALATLRRAGAGCAAFSSFTSSERAHRGCTMCLSEDEREMEGLRDDMGGSFLSSLVGSSSLPLEPMESASLLVFGDLATVCAPLGLFGELDKRS